jgi:hypothetical protein
VEKPVLKKRNGPYVFTADEISNAPPKRRHGVISEIESLPAKVAVRFLPEIRVNLSMPA